MSKNDIDFNYFSLYLLNFLTDEGDERAHDAEFINSRADIAASEFTKRRLEGYSVSEALEAANNVLTSDLEQNTTE